MGLSENVRICEVALQCFDIMRFAGVMLAHVFFECSLSFAINFATLRLLGSNDALHNLRVTHENIEAHLKDVVHFEFITEALLLLVGIDIAESLAT